MNAALTLEEESGSDFSLAPPAGWHDACKCDHFVQFYEDDAFLVNSVAGFIGEGLRSEENAIVIATEAHRIAIDEQLKRRGIDLADVRGSGRYFGLDAAATMEGFMVGGWPDEKKFTDLVGGLVAKARGAGSGVRAFGEMVALLMAAGQGYAAIRLEELWNKLGEIQQFSLFCAYPMNGFRKESDGRAFEHICKTHSRVIPAESYAAGLSVDQRLRAISVLQQKAASLERELQERKRVEAALRESEQKLRCFFETASIGLHRVGPDGIIVWANEAEMKLLGYSREEYVGHHISEFHADQWVINNILARLSCGEKLRDCEARLISKDGSIKHVLIDSSAFWRDDQFIHTQCFTRDVTARKCAEERLAVQSLVNRLLADSASFEKAAHEILQGVCETARWDIGAVWMVDERKNELRCVDCVHPRETRLDKFAADSRNFTFPPGVGLPGRVWKEQSPAWIVHLPTESNFPRCSIAAQAGLQSGVALPIRSGNGVLGVMEFFTRKTRVQDEQFLLMIDSVGSQIGQFIERKRGEDSGRLLAAIIESSDDAIVSKDLNGIIATWNKGAEWLFGYTASEAVGQPVTMLMPPDRYDEEPNILDKIRRGKRVEHYETVRRHKDGTLLDISLSISPVRNATGKIIGAAKIARDIGDRKRAQYALEASRIELARLNGELERRVRERTASLSDAMAQMEEFSYTVSHDLRAPLRAMHVYTKAILEDYGDTLPSEAIRHLKRVEDNATRLDRMIQDVLTFSRIGRAEFKLQPVSLNRLVLDVVEHYPGMQPPDAEIEIEPLLNVMGHEPSLTQALSNLLSNAVKFVPPGAIPRVRVWTERRDSQVRLWIEDSGIGVEPQHQHRLFVMFERIHPALKYDGNGVGLAIVRRAVDRMGGTVGMESDGVHGSRFWIQLPGVE